MYHIKILYCKKCGQNIKLHLKCLNCEILLHEEKDEYKCRCGKQHGIIGQSGKYCLDCEKELNLT